LVRVDRSRRKLSNDAVEQKSDRLSKRKKNLEKRERKKKLPKNCGKMSEKKPRKKSGGRSKKSESGGGTSRREGGSSRSKSSSHRHKSGKTRSSRKEESASPSKASSTEQREPKQEQDVVPVASSSSSSSSSKKSKHSLHRRHHHSKKKETSASSEKQQVETVEKEKKSSLSSSASSSSSASEESSHALADRDKEKDKEVDESVKNGSVADADGVAASSSTAVDAGEQQEQQTSILGKDFERQYEAVARGLRADGPVKLTDFKALQTVGTGTFGRVFLVQHRATQRHFAMKVMRKEDIVRLKQVDHIKNEREILALLRHPFIVTIHAAFQDAGHLYMLLEYVLGGEVFSHLRRMGRFTAEMARFYSSEIVLALEHMHSQHIVYRDLKPESMSPNESNESNGGGGGKLNN
jgi:protein kinase X